MSLPCINSNDHGKATIGASASAKVLGVPEGVEHRPESPVAHDDPGRGECDCISECGPNGAHGRCGVGSFHGSCTGAVLDHVAEHDKHEVTDANGRRMSVHVVWSVRNGRLED